MHSSPLHIDRHSPIFSIPKCNHVNYVFEYCEYSVSTKVAIQMKLLLVTHLLYISFSNELKAPLVHLYKILNGAVCVEIPNKPKKTFSGEVLEKIQRFLGFQQLIAFYSRRDFGDIGCCDRSLNLLAKLDLLQNIRLSCIYDPSKCRRGHKRQLHS